MASQSLEQMLELVPIIGQDKIYQTIDTYTNGTTQLYSFDPPKPIEGPGSILRNNYDLGGGYSL